MKLPVPRITMTMAAIACMSSPMLSNESLGGTETMRDKLQTTIGGSEYRVTGEVIGVEGNMYTLRTSGGETLKLEATDDTNMFCQSKSERSQSRQTSMSGQQTSRAGRMGSGMSSEMESGMDSGMSSGMSSGMEQQTQDQETDSSLSVSEKQKQAQESHAGTKTKGFRIGDCPFEKGEVIRAELTDKGTVTYMRSLDPQTTRTWKASERHEGKASGRSTEEMGLPQQYVFLPAGALGSMQKQDTEQYTVKTSDGEEVGNVYRVILNSQGDPEYVILREMATHQLKPLPWQAVEISPEEKTVTVVLSRAQVDGIPGYSPSDMSMTQIQDFWELAEAQEERRISRQGRGEDRFHEGPYEGSFESEYDRYTELGEPERYPARMGREPGGVGEPGDMSIWGSSSTLPPGGQGSPQYEGEDRRQFRGDEFRHRRYDPQQRGTFDRDRQARFSDEFRGRRGGGQYDPQQRRYFDRDRQQFQGDEFRHRRGGGQYDPQQKRYFDRNRQTRYSDDFQSRGDRQQRADRNRPSWYSEGFETPLNESRYMDPLTAPRYSDRDRDRYSFDQDRQSRYSDDFRSQRQRGRSSGMGYDDRPEQYRP